jgi:ribonuclease HI
MTYKAFFDGSAQPNPGAKTIGVVIIKPDGTKFCEFSKQTGFGTNNEAEYEALLEICHIVKDYNIKEINIMGDSMLVVNQVNGKWKCNKPNLIPLKNKVLYLLSGTKFTLTHVPREQNTEADFLSKGK